MAISLKNLTPLKNTKIKGSFEIYDVILKIITFHAFLTAL